MTDVILTNSARKDLHSIIAYIGIELGSPSASAKFANLFDEKIEILKKFPQLYPEYDFKTKTKQRYRFFIINNYMAFYYLKNTTVYIRRIVYSKQDVSRIFSAPEID